MVAILREWQAILRTLYALYGDGNRMNHGVISPGHGTPVERLLTL